MKHITCSLIFTFISIHLAGQDLINPYQNFNGKIILSDFRYPPANYNAPNPNNFLFTPSERQQVLSGQYSGEYMIMLDEHPWFINSLFQPLAKTFKIEVVSFPFTVPCWDQPDACGYPCYGTNTDRVFMMPDDVYNPNTLKWGNLNRVFEGGFIGPTQWVSDPGRLVSLRFTRCLNSPISGFNDGSYPHTILKHTVYLHCDPSPLSQIIASFSFLYDNTRGRMRYYPFQDNNLHAPGIPSEIWDVVFRPEILIDPDNVNFCTFSTGSNAGWFDGGSIDYFPFSQSNTSCGDFNPQIADWYADNFPPNPYNPQEKRASDYYFVFPAPYSLLSAFLRNNTCKYPAGYKPDPNNLSIFIERPGLLHHYQIDQNIDLELLNHDERKLYNPSEVFITSGANNLHFPSHYSFKTVRGIFPTTAEVLASNTVENGGPYSDPRDVPVPTDLSPVPSEPWLASLYTLEASSKLTFDPCLTVYDASFYLLPGSTLVIENADLLYGKHRHRIFNQGGHLLTRNQDIWLQNENILSGQQFSYEGKNAIEAGRQVTTSIPFGDFEIESGAVVNLKAESEIHLRDGFHAGEGSDFHAGIDQVTLLTCPPLRPTPYSDSSLEGSVSLNNPEINCIAFPNPTSGWFRIFLSDYSRMDEIRIISAVGKTVGSKPCRHQYVEEVDLNSESPGVYFIKVLAGKKIYSTKIILDN